MTNGSGWEPFDNLLMVEPIKTALEERLEKSGLKWDEKAVDKEKAGQSYVRVIAVGPGPFKRWNPEDAPKPGDVLLVKRYVWSVIDEEHTRNKKRVWLLQEDDVFARRMFDPAAESSLDFSGPIDSAEKAA